MKYILKKVNVMKYSINKVKVRQKFRSEGKRSEKSISSIFWWHTTNHCAHSKSKKKGKKRRRLELG